MLFQLISIQLIETWIIYNANFYENSTYLNGHPWSTQQVRGGRVIPIAQRSVKREGYVKESEYVRNLTIALFIFRFYSFNLQKQFQSFTRRRKFGKLIHYFFFLQKTTTSTLKVTSFDLWIIVCLLFYINVSIAPAFE